MPLATGVRAPMAHACNNATSAAGSASATARATAAALAGGAIGGGVAGACGAFGACGGATSMAAPSSSCASITMSGWPLLVMSKASLGSMMFFTAAVMHSSASGRKSTCGDVARRGGRLHATGRRNRGAAEREHLRLLLAKG